METLVAFFVVPALCSRTSACSSAWVSSSPERLRHPPQPLAVAVDSLANDERGGRGGLLDPCVREGLEVALTFFAVSSRSGVVCRAWSHEFVFLMGLRDDDFPGRHDKLIWAFCSLLRADCRLVLPVLSPGSLARARAEPTPRAPGTRGTTVTQPPDLRRYRPSIGSVILAISSALWTDVIWSDTLGRHLTTHVLMGVDGEDRQTAPAMVTIERGN